MVDATFSDFPTVRTFNRRIIAILVAATGNLVEWFDFYVYAFTSIYFAPSFFPGSSPVVQQLNTAAIFAAGFLMRPIGSLVFGVIADKRGRKTALLLSVLGMCLGSGVIAILPTYASIGILAPILLLVVRMLQGLAVGGEYGASATYMSEVAVGGHRGFFGAFQYSTLIGGQLIATLVLVVLRLYLNEHDMIAWGWRIPFIIGALVATIALLLRRDLTETASVKTRAIPGAGTLRRVFQVSKRNFWLVVIFSSSGSLYFYTFTTYMQKYLVNTAGFDKVTATNTMAMALLAYMLMQPLFGALSDWTGRKFSMIAFNVLAICCTVPLLTAIGATHSPTVALILIIAGLAIISIYTSISGLVKAELFPPEIRAVAVGFAFSIGNALFGGTAEFVAPFLKEHGVESWFYWYVTGMLVIGLIVAIIMPNPSKDGYLQGDDMER